MSNEWKDYREDQLQLLLEKMHEVNNLYYGWICAFVPDLIYELCDALGPYVEDFEVYQIKEKFGSLVVYWGWRYRDYTDLENKDRQEIDNVIKNIIQKYSDISYRTCVKCGNKATFLSSHWVTPWCDNCRDRKLGVFGIVED